MNKKIKMNVTDREEFQELPLTVHRLILPNGVEFTFQYNATYEGLEIVKAYSDTEGAVHVLPLTSNHIILK